MSLVKQKKKYKITKKRGISKDIIPKNEYDNPKKQYEYAKYYPSILDPAFSQKIARHDLFKKYKSTINKKRLQDLYTSYETNKPSIEDAKKKESSIFISKTISKMLRNFMSPYSPYRSLLIYHEMGVGKTCTSITIAESLKHITRNSNTKIYVIRPSEFERQLFNPNVVMDGEPLKQCTGDTYLQDSKIQSLVKECIKKNEEACEQLKFKVDKEIKGYYKFAGFKMWAHEVNKEIDARTKNIENQEEKEKKIAESIQKLFNNSVIIIDEAHELRDVEDAEKQDVKVITPVLSRVLKNATNIRLIFMSATPIYDKPQNILSLINYFLINDNRPVLKEADVFFKDGNLKPEGQSLLIENTRGYISFLRGSNPYEFPIRLSAKYNIPDDILDLSNYPKKNYQGKRLEKEDKINYLELVNCPLGGEQLKCFKYHIKHDKLIDFNEDTISNLSYSDITEESYSDNSDNSDNHNDNSDNPSDNKNYQNKKFKFIIADDGQLIKKNNLKTEEDEDQISIDEVISLEESLYGNVKYSKKASKQVSKQVSKQLSKKQSSKKQSIRKIRKDEPIKISTVAFQFESQMSNIVYQSLEECNNNLKLAVGDQGLDQIITKIQGKWTYEFNDDKYALRFKLPELYNWGAKIAKIIDIAIKSNGPVFIYTNFVNAGAKPIAIALEMNGFRRYKQHDTPLITSNFKEKEYRGDYILYTGESTLSAYAAEYINKGANMVREKNVKVFIGTSVASEGLNLFGYREVHILDPWHNINLTEQSIGRVIRTGSHIHLSPQERNVTVYQYAATLEDRESFDLKIYKIGEKKAIKAGIVEKILKQNAIDCELNKDVNIFDKEQYNRQIPQITSHGLKINVSLADSPFSRSCFYMKECGYNCITVPENNKLKEPEKPAFQIMRFHYEKELEEYRNLILQLVANSFNVHINHLREYLKKIGNIPTDSEFKEIGEKNKLSKKYKITKKGTRKHILEDDKMQFGKDSSHQSSHQSSQWYDEDAFLSAIQDIINTEPLIKDKYGREGKIVLSGDILRFIPNGLPSPNISISQQYLPKENPPLKSQIDLKGFISKISDEQKRLTEEQELDYNDILQKLIKKAEQIYYGVYQKEYRFNIKIKMNEILELLFNTLNYTFKVLLLKTILEKYIQGVKLSGDEQLLYSTMHKNIIYEYEIFYEHSHARQQQAKREQQQAKREKEDKDMNVYGFIIQNDNKLELFILTDDRYFEKNQGNIRKIIEYRKNKMKDTPPNNLYGFLKYEKGIDIPVFKIVDSISKVEKNYISGIKCNTKSTTSIKKYLYKLDDKIFKQKFITNKNALCNDIEILLVRNDVNKLNKKKWFYTPEEYFIFFDS